MGLDFYFKIFILILCLLCIAILTYFFFSSLLAMIRTKGVPYVPTFDADLKYFKDLEIPSGKTMVDLGCGDGKMLRYFVQNYGFKNGEGYDLNGFAVNYGKIINKLKKINNINLYKKNFKKVDLSKYDYIFVYLLPETMQFFEDWIFSNIREDAIVISNTFGFAKNEPYWVRKNSKGNTRVLFYKK